MTGAMLAAAHAGEALRYLGKAGREVKFMIMALCFTGSIRRWL
jgi:hypothetical protein